MKKRVYLSGRISGLKREIWQRRFATSQAALEKEGFDVMNPADTMMARHPWLYRLVGYRFTLWYDLRLLKRCTHIYMVEWDWHMSRGARLERLKAHKWDIEFLEI